MLAYSCQVRALGLRPVRAKTCAQGSEFDANTCFWRGFRREGRVSRPRSDPAGQFGLARNLGNSASSSKSALEQRSIVETRARSARVRLRFRLAEVRAGHRHFLRSKYCRQLFARRAPNTCVAFDRGSATRAGAGARVRRRRLRSRAAVMPLCQTQALRKIGISSSAAPRTASVALCSRVAWWPLPHIGRRLALPQHTTLRTRHLRFV